MRTKQNWFWLALLPALLCINCSDKKKANNQEEDVSTADALKQLATQAKELAKNGPVRTVDFRVLKAALPETASGLPRKEATGEKDEMAGFSVSTAEGKYSNDDGSETVEIELIDAGGSMATMGVAAWSIMDVDKETATGYERTTKIGDNKVYEKYDNASKDGEMAMLVNKRYIVTAKGHGVSMDQIRSVVEDIDLTKLEVTK